MDAFQLVPLLIVVLLALAAADIISQISDYQDCVSSHTTAFCNRELGH
jgi:hypothetical protein